MAINSTSKMLAKMQGQRKSSSPDSASLIDSQKCADINTNNIKATPQPTSASEMQNVLTNSLGAAFSKDYSPMD